MPIERPHVTSYNLTIAMFAISATFCKIFTVEMCMTLTFTMSQGGIEVGGVGIEVGVELG